MAVLTPDNLMDEMDNRLSTALPSRDTMMWLSFYLDYAISAGEVYLVEMVHDRTDKYYLDNFFVVVYGGI